MTTSQQAPYSQSAEESVIGAVLTKPLYYLNISANLSSSDFFFVRNAYIWDAIGRLETRGEPIDTVTVSEELQAHNQLAEIGGPAHLTQLIRNTPTSTHAEIYGDMVKRLAKRRELMVVADKIKLLCLDETINWKQVSEKAEAELLSVTVADRKQGATDIASIVHEYVDEVEALKLQTEQGIKHGVPTGFPSIDKIIVGSRKGELTIIAGPAKTGKSTFNLNIARNRTKMDANVVIFSCEMDRKEIIRKFVSMETGIPVDTLQDAKFTPQEFSLFMQASSKIRDWKMHIIDEYSAPTPLDIKRELRRIMHRDVVDCVLIDGLWKMRSDSPSGKDNLDTENIMKSLADMTKRLHIPIDVVHQMNRMAGTRSNSRPVLSDLSKSIGVEQEAHKIIFLYRPSYYQHDNDDNETEIIVAANRYGKVGPAIIGFNQDKELYHELEPRQAPQHYAPPPTAPIDTTRKDLQ